MKAVCGGRGVPYILCKGMLGLTVDKVMGIIHDRAWWEGIPPHGGQA
jgi:hypothetical protein